MSSLDKLTPVGSTVWGCTKPGSTDPVKYSYAPSRGTVIRPAQVTCGSCKIEHDFCLQLNYETETDPKRRADVLSAISGAITTCFDPTCGKTLAIPFANHGEDSQIVPFNPDTSTNIVKAIEGGRGTADGKLQGLKGSKAIASLVKASVWSYGQGYASSFVFLSREEMTALWNSAQTSGHTSGQAAGKIRSPPWITATWRKAGDLSGATTVLYPVQVDYRRTKADKNWPTSDGHQARLERLQRKPSSVVHTFTGESKTGSGLTVSQVICTVADTDRARKIFEAMSCFVGPVDTKNGGTTMWLRNPEFDVATCDETARMLLTDTPSKVLATFWATKTACHHSIAERGQPMVPPVYALAAVSCSSPTSPEIVLDSGIQILFKVSDADQELRPLFPAICSVDQLPDLHLGQTDNLSTTKGPRQTYTPTAGGARFVEVLVATSQRSEQ